MSVEAADRYVAAGAALLDEKGPENWRETLYAQREKLRVDSLTHCPLGLLYGQYDNGLDELGLDGETPDVAKLGFNSTREYFEEIDENDQASYSELLDAWLDAIEPEVGGGSSE